MEIRELIEISIKSLRENDTCNEYCILNNDLAKFKKLSIQIINNKEKSLELWIEQLKLLEIKQIHNFPIEAFLVVAREIERSSAYEKVSMSVDEFSTLIIKRLFTEVHFCIERELLYDLVMKIKVNNNVAKQKSILLKKIKKLTKLDIECTEDCIIGFKIENFSKVELAQYLYNERNWYYIPNSNIEVINIKSGNRVGQVFEDGKLLLKDNSYSILKEYLHINSRNNIILSNQYERMLMYSFIKYYIEIYNKETAIVKIGKEIVDNIMEYKELFSNDYQRRMLNKTNTETIQTYISKLENNPTNQELRNIINECNDIDWIFEVLKLAPQIIKDVIPIDIHIAGIVKCNSIDRHNIKIALYCEDLLENNPIIIEEVVEFLVGMYKEGIFTETTEKILKYLRCTVRNNKIIDDAQINVIAEKGNLDNNFIDKFINVYGNSDDKRSLDNIVNKIINRNDYKINKELYGVIYEFYKMNNDIRALDILCNAIIGNKDNLRSVGVTSKDITKLLNYFISLDKYDNTNTIFIIINEFKESKDVAFIASKILEEMGTVEFENAQTEDSDIYFEILSIAKEYNETLSEVYIRMLINKGSSYKYSKAEIEDLLDTLDLDNLKEKESLKIIAIVIKYYISTKNNLEALKYLKIYLEKLSSIDDGDLFRDILSSYNNLDFIEDILKEVDFTKIEKVDLLLNMTFDRLVLENRYELLVEILRYYNNTERYNESLYVLKGYINNVSCIDSLIYEVFILPILRNISELRLKELYDALILREDLPIEIREEFYYLNTDEYNTNKIISEFKNYNTYSSLAKNLALKKYYYDDSIFEELILRGSNDGDTCKIILEKVKEKFKDNKGFVELIITDEIAELDDELRKIKSYATEYNENLFTLECCNVFGEFFISEKIDGELCSEIELNNIFSDEKISAVLFKNDTLYDIYTKYLNSNNVKFDIIDIKVISVNNDMKWILPEELSLVKLLNNFNKLVKLQILLMNNKMIMLEFVEESFKLNKDGFVLNSFVNICGYNGEIVVRDRNIFKNINGIRNKNKRVIINEQNIVKIMCEYIKRILLNGQEVEDNIVDEKILINERRMRDKFIDYISVSEINSLEELYSIISLFIDKESKAFEELSYRKQISMFNDLNDEEKILVISKAIRDKDTTPIIRNKVIYFDNIPPEIIEDYFVYLIDCFNNTMNLTKDDYGYIYDKITNLLKGSEAGYEGNMLNAILDKNIIKDQANELATLYIDSIKKCKYIVRDVEDDIRELKQIDVEYILSRLNKG